MAARKTTKRAAQKTTTPVVQPGTVQQGGPQPRPNPASGLLAAEVTRLKGGKAAVAFTFRRRGAPTTTDLRVMRATALRLAAAVEDVFCGLGGAAGWDVVLDRDGRWVHITGPAAGTDVEAGGSLVLTIALRRLGL